MNKNKVTDIAKMFGGQVSSKKPISMGTTKEIRYSEILRIEKSKLKNVASNKTDKMDSIQIKNINDNESFAANYAENRKQSKPSQSQIQDPKTDGKNSNYNTLYNDIISDINISDTEISDTVSIGDTYGIFQSNNSSRRSSFISSISSSSTSDEWPEIAAKIINGNDEYCLYDSENNIGNDNDNDNIDILVCEAKYDHDYEDDDEEEQKMEFTRKRELQITQDLAVFFDCSDSDDIDINCQTGAIKMSDYRSSVQNENKTKSVNVNMNVDIFAADQFYIDSDDEYYSCGSYNEYEISIDQLLQMFGLRSDTQVCDYLCNILCIKYANDMIDILPQKIMKPMDYKMKLSIVQVMKIHKMAKWMSQQVYQNIYDGEYKNEWIALEHNKINKTFQEKSSQLLQWNNNEYFDDTHFSKITLNGYDTNETKMNVKHMKDREITVTLAVEQLPLSYRFEPKLFMLAIEVSGANETHSLCITDRLLIRKNEMYLDSMFVGNFVENGSHILMKLRLSETEKCVSVQLSHKPNGQRTKFDHGQYTKNFDIQFDENIQEANMSIHQYNGNGKYWINIK